MRTTIAATRRDAPTLEHIVSLAKRRGFVFPGSEIDGGPGSTATN